MMFKLTNFIIVLMLVTLAQGVSATGLPSQVATIVIHGFDPVGASSSGVVGIDETGTYATDWANIAGLPLSTNDPLAPNQVAYTEYYGDQYPAYYTQQDIDEVDAITVTSSGGVPRYASIIGKFAKEVMSRSGAAQVNIVGLSFGGLISHYMIENDVEGLASSGKIARWISIEGVVAGNYGATYGGPLAKQFFEANYGSVSTIDLEHMKYDWVEANVSNPRNGSNSVYMSEFPSHFWVACDDNMYGKFLTNISGKANDGVGLQEDAVLNLSFGSKYLGMQPTISAMHTTHESTKTFEGLKAGLIAQLYSRKRVTITLNRVKVLREFDGGTKGQGEYVFGLKVYSPKAETDYGVVKPIHQLRAEDNNFEFLRMDPNTSFTANLKWFDDMVLPGESQLRLVTNVEEIDGDLIYNITETNGESRTALANTTTTINLAAPGTYTMQTTDWVAEYTVALTDYPAFENIQPVTDAKNWSLYE